MAMQISIIDLMRAETERRFAMDLTALRIEDQTPPVVPSARAMELRTDTDVHGPATRSKSADLAGSYGGELGSPDFGRVQLKLY